MLRKDFLDLLAREIKKSKKSLENDGYFTAIDLSQSRVSVTDLVTSKNGSSFPLPLTRTLTLTRTLFVEDIRKGKFVFAHGGWYEGEWFMGKPHGEGVYEKDEKRFEGFWNAHLDAGYGYDLSNPKALISHLPSILRLLFPLTLPLTTLLLSSPLLILPLY